MYCVDAPIHFAKLQLSWMKEIDIASNEVPLSFHTVFMLPEDVELLSLTKRWREAYMFVGLMCMSLSWKNMISLHSRSWRLCRNICICLLMLDEMLFHCFYPLLFLQASTLISLIIHMALCEVSNHVNERFNWSFVTFMQSCHGTNHFILRHHRLKLCEVRCLDVMARL